MYVSLHLSFCIGEFVSGCRLSQQNLHLGSGNERIVGDSWYRKSFCWSIEFGCLEHRFLEDKHPREIRVPVFSLIRTLGALIFRDVKRATKLEKIPKLGLLRV